MTTRLLPAILPQTLHVFLGLTLLGLALTPLDSSAQVSVELVTATSVEDREPSGASEAFPLDVGRVWAWMRVSGATDQAIEVIWSHGPHTFNVPLEIGGSPWRTWSSKIIPPYWAGEWTVEVRDAQGTTVATTSFTVGG